MAIQLDNHAKRSIGRCYGLIGGRKGPGRVFVFGKEEFSFWPNNILYIDEILLIWSIRFIIFYGEYIVNKNRGLR